MDRRGFSYITWPVKSPDLTPFDFFLRKFVKDRVYRAPVRELADLQDRIYAAVNNVTPQMDIFYATNGSQVEVYGT